ncbi:MAG: DUF892 family protein [Balneolia bacterium]|nr:DUF892 family protein [Balneolia bacterium]
MMAPKTSPVYSDDEAGSKEKAAAEQITTFAHDLRKILWIEKALLHFIPKTIDFTASATLKEAFNAHHKQIKGHIIRLESVFKPLRMHPESLKDTRIEPVLAEAELRMKNNRNSVQDAQIVETLLLLNTHKQEAYKLLSEKAQALEMTDSVRLLLEMHAQEKAYAETIAKIPTGS